MGDVDVALKKASVTVSDTSATADKILKDVVSATQTMTSSSSECLTSFDSFICKEGKVTQNALGVHFKVLDSFLVTQSAGLDTITATTQQVQHTALHYNTQHCEKCLHINPLGDAVFDLIVTLSLSLLVRRCLTGDIGYDRRHPQAHDLPPPGEPLQVQRPRGHQGGVKGSHSHLRIRSRYIRYVSSLLFSSL